ncbi:putative fluoride ion transporter CrcB [Sulfuriferula plumbiphila]|uniref:Fluoride-specific ion channel FluC n=1 Tax=Sulfuriferula plumbiphila TaxID=171865 RepID=A0A512L6R4_9PROT|nr:fluoride efflux transporter CrcB [Sulfuriferula plumbiphila]BBP04896.1 putative fluoride ion transporter CrcB [Sulfuriferula plumbiphila]GEP30169.1 putative fluoride ion transporter CrcB [Sulfuriferula plumbiphila]
MGVNAFLAIGVGAALGAWLRWGLGLWLNPLFPTLPMGTLAANLLGGYLIGLAMAFFASYTGLAPEARLLVITGFLGGLTTFSTFSAEIFTLLSRQQWGWGLTSVFLHLVGSVLMTALGVLTFRFFRG